MVIFKRVIHILAIVSYILIGTYAILCLPMISKYKPLVVLSSSMEPTFKKGSVVYYKPVKKEDLKIGDVITYTSLNGDLISHRILSIKDDFYETKGDMNESPDSLKIGYNSIRGKNINFCIPYIGYYIQYINKNLYISITLIIILVIEFVVSNTIIFDTNKTKRGEENV